MTGSRSSAANRDAAVQKYLEGYAEPEARLADELEGRFDVALVVPVCREASDFLEGYQGSIAGFDGRVLVIVVVNAPEDADAATLDENARLLADLEAAFPDRRALAVATTNAASEPHAAEASLDLRATLAHANGFDVLWIDRSSPGRRLSRREGVGRARRIGMDLAVRLWQRKRLAGRIIGASDADAVLPHDYFTRLFAHAEGKTPIFPADTTALLYPFTHVASGEAMLDAATWLYEASLRYYTLGLCAAGSAYAYHSIGSTLAIDAGSYAKVRGFPRRAAGEDFYLLDKLAKVGPLLRLRGEPVCIRARRSERVPFGTGRRVQEIIDARATGTEPTVQSPSVFRALGAWLAGLDAFALSARVSALSECIALEVPEHAAQIEQAARSLGAFDALESAAHEVPQGAPLRRRTHTWFDALRTLRFTHALRDGGMPEIPLGDALAQAPFLRGSLHGREAPAAAC
jgi:hypothetical protein